MSTASIGPLFASRAAAGFTLRPYQTAAIEQVGERGRVLLCCPTGGGKTLVACALIAQRPAARVLFVAHRLELIDQTAATLQRLGIHDLGVIRADDSRSDLRARVQVASIQTLVRRKDIGAFDICFVDECHRATADSYRTVFDRWPTALHVGLTATPVRMSGKPLGDVYDRIVPVADYSQLIADRFIAEPTVYSTPHQPDLSRVRTVAGDYHDGDLSEAMQGLVGSVAEEIAVRRDGRRCVVFAVSIDHSRAIVARLEALGLRAAHLDGTTEISDRRGVLSALDAGDLDVVSNVGVLTEGWDMPSVKLASIARPTKSLSLWMQMAGRILRPWNDVRPILLDHGDNVRRHDVPTVDREWSLDAAAKPKATQSPYRLCKACFAYFAIGESSCPHCGWSVPPPDPKPERTAEDGRALVEVKAKTERDVYDSFVARARDRGFKPGFAGVQFKEKHGKWPPWAWSQQTKAEFAADVDWQSRVDARSAERDKWAAINERKRATAELNGSVPADFDDASEAVADVLGAENDPANASDSFGDWLAIEGVSDG